MAISPLVLPTRAYSFTSASTLRASANAFTFSESGDVVGTSAVQGAATASFPASGTIFADGQLQASDTVSFTASATQDPALRSSQTVSVAAGGTISALVNRQGSTAITFSQSATTIRRIQSLSPLVLPTRKYSFSPAPPTMIGTTTIGFSDSASLTGTGGLGGTQIRGSTVIDIFEPAFLWLVGKGELKGSATVTLSESATLAGGVQGSAVISFGQVGDVSGGPNPIVGNTTITFGETPDIRGIGELVGTAPLPFTETGTTSGIGSMFGATVVRFLNPGMLIRTVEATSTFSVVASGTITGIPEALSEVRVRFDGDATASARFEQDALVSAEFVDDAEVKMVING